VVFAVPYFHTAYHAELDELLAQWIDRVSGIKCSARAWNFPLAARRKAQHDHSFYPGVAVLLQR
jgi:hypothetical protein